MLSVQRREPNDESKTTADIDWHDFYMIFTNADPRYAGRLDDKQGGDTTVTMERVREAITFNAELTELWLTSEQLVAYHLAPAITDFISDEYQECCKNELEQTRQILEERRSDCARAYCDPEAARRLLERDEKELRDFEFSFGTFRKNIECPDPGDLCTQMDEGQKWVQEHFAPEAKNFLETRQRFRWKIMTNATNQAGYRGVWVTFQGIQIDTKIAAIKKLQALGFIFPKRNGGVIWNFLPTGSNPAGLNIPPSP